MPLSPKQKTALTIGGAGAIGLAVWYFLLRPARAQQPADNSYALTPPYTIAGDTSSLVGTTPTGDTGNIAPTGGYGSSYGGGGAVVSPTGVPIVTTPPPITTPPPVTTPPPTTIPTGPPTTTDVTTPPPAKAAVPFYLPATPYVKTVAAWSLYAKLHPQAPITPTIPVRGVLPATPYVHGYTPASLYAMFGAQWPIITPPVSAQPTIYGPQYAPPTTLVRLRPPPALPLGVTRV